MPPWIYWSYCSLLSCTWVSLFSLLLCLFLEYALSPSTILVGDGCSYSREFMLTGEVLMILFLCFANSSLAGLSATIYCFYSDYEGIWTSADRLTLPLCYKGGSWCLLSGLASWIVFKFKDVKSPWTASSDV